MKMNRYRAALHLDNCGTGGDRLSAIYDRDAQLRAALSILVPDFEYPDYAQKTLAQIRNELLMAQDQAPELPEVLPGATALEIQRVTLRHLVGEYNTLESVAEWGWLGKNASFSQTRNGSDDVFAYVLNLGIFFRDIPELLLQAILDARENDMVYLVVQQASTTEQECLHCREVFDVEDLDESARTWQQAQCPACGSWEDRNRKAGD